MYSDRILNEIHDIQHGRVGLVRATHGQIAKDIGCSVSYAARVMKHYRDTGVIAAVAIKYKNTTKIYYTDNYRVEALASALLNYGYSVLYVYQNGEMYTW